MPITDESIVIPVPPEEVFGHVADVLANKAYARQVRANIAALSEILTERKNHETEE
ncbi:hypothetical protein [Arthrobacter sp. NyZ413]|uniref:hypothetical protein n=1 Tax=Arthrobacter sp. NyZ413 TaxID=3144669 RepID=UPI003BF8948B